MWLTVKELASYIKIKEKTLYNLANRGSMPHYRIGRELVPLLVEVKKDPAIV